MHRLLGRLRVTTDCCYEARGWVCNPPQIFFLHRAAASVTRTARFLSIFQRTLQQLGVDRSLSSSRQCLWRLLPPHHKQRGGCLRLVHRWSNRGQLKHCVRPARALYASTLMIWLPLNSWIISWDFSFLVTVIRNKGRLIIWLPPWRTGRLVAIWRSLITLKPSATRALDIPSAGVSVGRQRITALVGSSDLGWEVK